jgi:hypothetical protein
MARPISLIEFLEENLGIKEPLRLVTDPVGTDSCQRLNLRVLFTGNVCNTGAKEMDPSGFNNYGN